MKATSRTHEENQERAYIAASRRSDRSVEARVESARRASEIHKKRTGKGLKVTEKDVLADEMYEEEDDELPAQYRNLNAHLQTGSSDFDARLQAYLANAVAFRKALSGVAKPGDRKQHADFVNKKQLADHTSLFPKHSDAWKDIVIPKCSDSSSAPFLPQGSSHKYAPYDAKKSHLRRMSTHKAEENSMGTLTASDLKNRPGSRYSSNHFMSPVPNTTPDYTTKGINYDAIAKQSPNTSESSFEQTSSDYPFSARLPANALDMLMAFPSEGYNAPLPQVKTGYENVYGDCLNQNVNDSIDATLVSAPAPVNKPAVASVVPDTSNWNMALWDETAQQQDSGARKVLENDMWGSFIDESAEPAWDWNGLTA